MSLSNDVNVNLTKDITLSSFYNNRDLVEFKKNKNLIVLKKIGTKTNQKT